MGFGSFKKTVFILLLIFGRSVNYAQDITKTSEFLYNQLDNFLEKPSNQSLEQLRNIISSKESELSSKEDLLAWVIIHSNLGYYYNRYGNISSGITHYEKAWKTYSTNNLKDYDIIENCLQPLGNLYLKIGDLKKAESTITNYLFIAEQNRNISKMISAITNLSITYHNQSEYDKALEILHKGEKIQPNNPNILTNLATNYLDKGAIRKAEKLAKRVLSIDPKEVNAYKILAFIALENNNATAAKQHLSTAKRLLLDQSNVSAREIAKWQLAYTDILISKKEYKEALASLKEIHSLLLPTYYSEVAIPKKQTLVADQILLKALDTQAYIYQQLNDPISAIKSLEAAFIVNSKLNIAYPLQSTKIIQHGQNRNRTENYIELLYTLYQKTNEIEYLQKAFNASENSKAPFVNEALVSKRLLFQYKSDSLIKKNEQLHIQLAVYETNILKEKLRKDQADISLIQKWSEQHSNISIQLKELSKTLQEKYPNLISDQQTISVPQLHQKLKEDKLLLVSYFFGKNNIYQFTGNEKTLNILKIENNTLLKNSIRDYVQYFDDASNITNDINGFSKASFNLYKSLKIPNSEKLLIIPDGLLNFVPFEALLTEETDAFNFENMPFLVKSSMITYENSINKYLRATNSNHLKKNVLGVFPVFQNTNLELPFSVDEKKHIEEHFDGTFLKNEDATYANFIDQLKDHTILHLSTHAASGSFASPASIQFTDQNILVNQLYGLQLDADLVVLSACETGVGAIAKGEGPLSIARGFQYAGIPNTLFSLWKVNDKTTSQLMRYFYKNLKDQNSNTHSLHTSKLEYLTSKKITNAQKSPYYWASFVYYGSYEHPVTKSYWIIISILFFIIVLLLLLIRRKLK
ncbi:CHAT domain-containing protein [uncultured Aquimarina sp.]|uniref:CHAT domain-containing protein n=1 Tax=uncultured Aquimarina sp. TaxID=575652 RepID=UPI002637B83D|nr:CHAT domain-containing protein [uncultured Aquimarina sp.]